MPATLAAVAAAAPEKNRVTIGKINEVPHGTQPRPIAAAIEAILLTLSWRATSCSLRLLRRAVNITTESDNPCRIETINSSAPFGVVKPCLNSSISMLPVIANLSTIGNRDKNNGP